MELWAAIENRERNLIRFTVIAGHIKKHTNTIEIVRITALAGRSILD